jgi:hypothetical protein
MTHVLVYVQESCKNSKEDFMERRFLKMIVEEGNCVGYAQGSSSRRIWGNRKRSWKGRSTITPIGQNVGTYYYTHLSTYLASAQVKRIFSFFIVANVI